ncbi:conserved hypothetical protein [Neospora caninum Liverpool]|uniref:Oligomerization domain protein n=1 Tax=Neospora caninum (strain Liverpool) TaxID=572307 RepID=F0VDT7_NEOCL|nr:conserved hypothetical protein [Neospora caninum Liverpool]CBZ51880.1 conserved hypothetical protein [Neospora caninum Liverpool]CEL65840.1 TPA: hypothetical protein BN1204_016720 [Neospora caninum Liverpool]|eukprot:XP_003881913.1 conserved hypothetical protein [Neospora caninum Liverpool]
MEKYHLLLLSSVILCIFGRVLPSSTRCEAITIHRDASSCRSGPTHFGCAIWRDTAFLRSPVRLVNSPSFRDVPPPRGASNSAKLDWRRPPWLQQEVFPSLLLEQGSCLFGTSSFIQSRLIKESVYDGYKEVPKLAVYKTLKVTFPKTPSFGQQSGRRLWSEERGFGSHYAVPLVTGLTGCSDVNQNIPQFLLPPLFTAVRTGDKHKAQTITALWKKPGVPRVGWVDDRYASWHEQQRIPGSATELNESSTIGKAAVSQLDGTSPGSEKSELTVENAAEGLAPQGEGMVIMTGTSASHLDSLAEVVIAALWETHMRKLLGRDGRGYSGWIVLAFMDLEVHIMTPVMRERYALEELYGLCPRIDISDCIRVDSLESFDLYREGFKTLGSAEHPFPEGF